MPFVGDIRDVFATKMLRFPLQAMHQRIFDITGGDKSRDTLRYVIYSAHDVQVGNILEWLRPMDDYYPEVEYSSAIIFELYYDTKCMETLRDEGCFTVKVSHNGTPIKLDTCIEGNLSRGDLSHRCTYTDFRKHILKISYNGVLEDKCNEEFVPPE